MSKGGPDLEYILKMNKITKIFPGTKALNAVDFSLKKGTLHALMGENGAGKSTLMKILAGIHRPDEGEIVYDGKKIIIETPSKALKLGIAMIHQELMPVLEMTVAENIFLGREPLNKGLLDYKILNRQTKELLDYIGMDVEPTTKMKKLKVSEMQLVEIAKAVSYDSKIIIMDEPTSAITDREVEKLFVIIKELVSKGKSIIYISHKIDEIFRISDFITVLRDGDYIETVKTSEIAVDQLIKLMVGRELIDIYPRRNSKKGNIMLSVKGLTHQKKFHDISFDLKEGEILGISGLMGAGRTEVMESIFGLRKLDAGDIFINGKKVKIRKPIDAINNGLAFVTEDRKYEGLSLPLSVKHNMTISALDKFSKNGIISRTHENEVVDEQIKSLRIKTPNSKTAVKALSGGNQQKVVIGKWILTNPKILILDEPTRGIDIGAKTEIYKLMNKFVEKGYGIIMISSELPEVLGMSDRIIVFYEGHISGELENEAFCQEHVMALATGQIKER